MKVSVTGPRVGASALVQREDGKIVLVKRSKEPGKGRWALPGGLTEYGEEVEETAVREVEEETGLNIKLLSLVGVYDIIGMDEKDQTRCHYVSICFKGKKIGGKLRAGSDVKNVGWFSPLELKEEMLTEGTFKALKDTRILVTVHLSGKPEPSNLASR